VSLFGKRILVAKFWNNAGRVSFITFKSRTGLSITVDSRHDLIRE
jgi:hypothetical protein